MVTAPVCKYHTYPLASFSVIPQQILLKLSFQQCQILASIMAVVHSVWYVQITPEWLHVAVVLQVPLEMGNNVLVSLSYLPISFTSHHFSAYCGNGACDLLEDCSSCRRDCNATTCGMTSLSIIFDFVNFFLICNLL